LPTELDIGTPIFFIESCLWFNFDALDILFILTNWEILKISNLVPVQPTQLPKLHRVAFSHHGEQVHISCRYKRTGPWERIDTDNIQTRDIICTEIWQLP
jgi:hypothetical protein